jgi:RNA polymerase sigma-70 factor (ECF subfamily)
MSDIAHAYERRRRDYLRVAAAILGDPDSASDVVHEAFLSAIRSRPSFRADGPLEGWIWTIVVNLARDRRRQDGRYMPAGECDQPLMLAGTPERPELPVDPAALRAQIARLPERQRLVVFLRFYADLDYAQIGRLLGISTGTVGATLHAALQSLDPGRRA